MDIIKRNFGDCLKNLRKIKNYTQEQLAEAIGINLRQLARIEAGESFVTSETIYKICTTLEIAPWELFNFDIQAEYLMTGTDNVVHLNVIREGHYNHILSQQKLGTLSEPTPKTNNDDFDKKMLNLSKSLKKEIIVDEIKDGHILRTKKYYPDGSIQTDEKYSDNGFDKLKSKVESIKNDKDKISFINLAFDAISSRAALEELKIFIKGIELTQNNI